MKTLIENIIVDGEQTDMIIEDGRIKAFLNESSKEGYDKIIDGKCYTALPGLVDVHVHFRDPGQEAKETIETGSKAAAAGGFTSVLAMANTKPVIDNVERLESQIKRNEENGVIKVGQIAAISADLTGKEVGPIEELADAGAAAFSNDGHGLQSAKTMYEAQLAIKAAGKVLSAHIEDDDLVDGGVMNAGDRADKLGLPGMNSLSESSQLARDLMMVRQTRCSYHVAHISTKESVDLVRQAKKEGLPVTAEVSPHHLFLDETDIISDDPMFKMNPPLRSREDRLALVAGLLDGTIDMVATDHAPHQAHEKQGSMCGCAFGIVGLETAFPLMYTRFVASGLVDLQTLLKWMVKNPIAVFGLKDAGELKVGDSADLTLIDLTEEFEIDAKDFYSKGKNSPFIGESVFGRVKKTMVDGNIVFEQ
ncbi:dihydroorotase [Fructobacillus sp. M2-14]|uniref:Dihydroorotase n=1 Tax=Fructobacillus broussonetiae TaxID=2713173 RepID=A0ABS5R1T0_9LACO|nr:dihydroorotase [Fructobacillus broussonetiae]MBS9338127.1 dihydroorotase [Fructobacillus broussonetiae]